VPLVAAVVGGVVGALLVLLLVHDDDHASSAGRASCPAVRVADDVLPSVVTVQVVQPDGTGGNGTGSVFRKGGYILTNEHVVTAAVQGGAKVTVHYSDGSSSAASLVGADAPSDLAILKAEDGASGRPVLGYDDSDSARVGQPVVALGAPLGLSNTVTSGIVSALGRYVPVPSSSGQVHHLLDAIQTDASINPGNSGGPLVDCSGTQVGVNSAISTAPNAQGVPGGGSVGLGFAIPMRVAVPIAGELIDTGRANHPDFGLTARTAANESQSATAVVVTSVVPGGPADDAGLAAGDVIVEIDGQPAHNTEALVLASLKHDAGDTVEVTYLRDGDRHTTKLVLGSAS
jgi:putative serine protease PepD